MIYNLIVKPILAVSCKKVGNSIFCITLVTVDTTSVQTNNISWISEFIFWTVTVDGTSVSPTTDSFFDYFCLLFYRQLMCLLFYYNWCVYYCTTTDVFIILFYYNRHSESISRIHFQQTRLSHVCDVAIFIEKNWN